MHEISVMTNIIKEILKSAQENRADKVKCVTLEIGELTLLGIRQLRFAYEILSKEFDLLRDSKIVLRKKKGTIRCLSCHFEGSLCKGKDSNHIYPIFRCPKCNGKVDIIAGRECILVNIKLTRKDLKDQKQ